MSDITSTIEEKTAFEKARFQHCIQSYDREEFRKEKLEKKAQFYLSFTTLFLGSIFLNISFLKSLNEAIIQTKVSISFRFLIYLCMLIIAVSTIITLLAILKSLNLYKYRAGYQQDFVSSMFSNQSEFSQDHNEISLLKSLAMDYAIALESNRKINDRMTRWIDLSSISLFVAVISLAFFLVLTGCLLLL